MLFFSLAGSRQAQAAAHPATLAQSCSVADAVAHVGPPPEGLHGPRALSGLRVARGHTDTHVHLAPLDVGALALPPVVFSRGALTSWWVPVSLAR